MATVYKAPHPISDISRERPSVFLAGSIEMGTAEKWQAKFAAGLEGLDVNVLDPRRDDWDSSWTQDISNDQFREQVEWELECMERADLMVVYFDPSTKAPITLMELGLHAIENDDRLVVCCPDGFWRKGNVDIVCRRYCVRQLASLDAMINFARERCLSLAKEFE